MTITEQVICGPEKLPIVRLAPWAVNDREEDAAAEPVKLKDAPGVGYSLYVTELILSDGLLKLAICLRNGDTDNLFGPVLLEANGEGNFLKDFEKALKLTTNTALYVSADDLQNFTVYVEGFTGKDEV